MKNFRSVVALAAAAIALSSCSRMSDIGFDTRQAIGSVSLVDRCSDFMHRAFPESGIRVTSSHVATSTANAAVTVAGVRDAVPANAPFARDVAAECQFDSGVLTGFRWTVGPLHPGDAAPAR